MPSSSWRAVRREWVVRSVGADLLALDPSLAPSCYFPNLLLIIDRSSFPWRMRTLAHRLSASIFHVIPRVRPALRRQQLAEDVVGVAQGLRRAAAAPAQQLGGDTEGDLVGGLGVQIEADGRIHPRQRLRRDARAQQRLEDSARFAGAADHADV